ncbi:ATPase [Aureococcus anophagefferens]|nr:ATPase [Aureococcus anophagefferens]
MFKNKKLRQQLHNDVFFVSKISGVFHHALNSVFEALTQRYTDLGEGEVMKWFSSEYLENGAWTRAELPPGFPNDTNTLEASNKTPGSGTEYTMKPVLAFLSDIFAYVQDKSQLNAEFAYDAPPSTPQTKLAKDATAVLSSVRSQGRRRPYDILTSGTHLTSMLLIIGVKPDLAAPPVAFISDATYVYAPRARHERQGGLTTEVDRRLAPFVGLATGDASSSSGRGARRRATDDRPVASNRGPSRRHARRGGARDNDTLTNPPRPAPKFAFLGAPRDAPRDTA